MLGPHQRLAREQRGALDRVLELAHVARPGRFDQAPHGRLGEALEGLAELLAEAAQEVHGELGDVTAARAQRRHAERHHVEAVEEVLAEAALLDRRGQVAVRGGDDARVHGAVAARAHAAVDALLKNAQELGLARLGELADLVEEQAAAFRGGHQPRVPLRRATGEGARLVAEELGLEQRLGQGRAVDRHERALGARRAPVDRARDELLADARLALDQDRRARRGRHALDQRQELAQALRRADHRAAPEQRDLLAQPIALAAHDAVLQHALEHALEDHAPHGLLEEVGGSLAHGGHGGRDVGQAGQEDDRGGFAQGDQLAQELEAGQRQVEVEQAHVRVVGARQGQDLAGRMRLAGRPAGLPADGRQARQHPGVPVGDQDLPGHRAGF